MATTNNPARPADAARTGAGSTSNEGSPGPADGPRSTRSAGATRGHDPAYALPLLGPLIEQADRFRSQLPIGPSWNKGEAEVLRAEAKALRAVAGYLEARAKQLDRLQRHAAGEKPRVRRVPVD